MIDAYEIYWQKTKQKNINAQIKRKNVMLGHILRMDTPNHFIFNRIYKNIA